MKTKHLLVLSVTSFLFTFCSDPQIEDANTSPTSSADLASFGGSGGFGPEEWKGEGYNEVEENPFIITVDEPVSTFSIDADGASYSNTRRFLTNNRLPPKAAIRTEEFINYFPYDYPQNGNAPISLNGEVSDCPWTPGHKLLRIGIRGKDIPDHQLPASNFVLLIDVSGSMKQPGKLDLLKRSFKLFVDEMDEDDKLAIVTYAGKAGVLLEPTTGRFKDIIKSAIDGLDAGGSTAGAQGIITAYQLAEEAFIPGGNNRVILGSDGDFNVGISNQDELVELIEEKRESGVFLTILGVGTGNLQDGKMEQIANNGNGNYEYLDNIEQAKKVFIHEFKKFYTVAKDVKIQINFNPEQVRAYRLIGYENRLLEESDFEDDSKDAGEIGANQTITALYELIPAGGSGRGPVTTVDFRYKEPASSTSIPLQLEIPDREVLFNMASENMRFATAAAGFALLLGESEYKGILNYNHLVQWAINANSYDPHNYRWEFIDLVNKAKDLQ